MTRILRVLVADDQTLVRQGIRSLLDLTPDVRVVAEASDGEEALAAIDTAAAARTPPSAPSPSTTHAEGSSIDVALLDVRMPRRSGLEVLDALATRAGAPACIVLTTFDDDEVALRAVRAGARGFLLKDVSLEQLAQAIRTVAAGGTLINPAVTARLVRGDARLDAARPRDREILGGVAGMPALTRREVEVLRLMSSGASNKEIAAALGTAEATVKNQAASIFAKLGVDGRTRAVLRAIELGIL